ncbi:MAG: PqqD family peptide modification chaperone [Halobacteriota archaeon]
MNPPKTTTGTGEKDLIEIDLTKMVVANPVVSCRVEREEGAVLFNPDTDDVLLINPTGLAIWKFLDQPHAIDDIVSHLKSIFKGGQHLSEMKQDVEAFIRELAPDFIFEAVDDVTNSGSR